MQDTKRVPGEGIRHERSWTFEALSWNGGFKIKIK